MNPEFQRNVWLELTKHRLIAMPVVLGLIFWTTYLAGSAKSAFGTANTVLFLILAIWGSRLASNSLAEEVTDNTWETQRLLPTKPWQMTWGKLFGSTIYAWYGGLWCVLYIFWICSTSKELNFYTLHLIYEISQGIFVQSLAFFFSLLLHRINPYSKHLQVFFAQIAALGVMLISPMWLLSTKPFFKHGHFISKITWYDMSFETNSFLFWSQIIFIAWIIIGIYRLLSVELQCKPKPWIWLLFVLYSIIYTLGFIYDSILHKEIVKLYYAATPIPNYLTYIFLAYFIASGATFISAVLEPKQVVTIKKWLCEIKQKNLFSALQYTPAWVISMCLVVALFIIGLISSVAHTKIYASSLVCLFLFLWRDIGITYYLTLNSRNIRGYLASVIYIALLYSIIPAFLMTFQFGKEFLLSAFLPFANIANHSVNPIGTILLLLQVLGIWYATSRKLFKYIN